MFIYLLLLFTIVPAIELMLLIQVGGHIGSLNTIMLIIFTGILGAWLARLQGFLTLQKIQQTLNSGSLPSNELMDGLMILIGGLVLLTPGFITDAIGFILLIPFTRAIIKAIFRQRFEGMLKKGQVSSYQAPTRENKRYDDIDIN